MDTQAMENKTTRRRAAVLIAALACGALLGQDRPVPPPGVAVPEADRKELTEGVARLSEAIRGLGTNALAPDVAIFRDAVRYALDYNEFLAAADIGKARALLAEGMKRAGELQRGAPSWVHAKGLVVRGYVSRIDGSVQPYGLEIPDSFDARLPRKWRLDAWFHGRAETLTEVNFLSERMSRPGQFQPPHAIVLHLYGRYCNANKFAGEIDLFEALAAVKKQYPIDDDRILVRGFSMGGAAAWHIAAHYGGRFAAAAPGAGFSETAEFLNVFANEKVSPPEWEQKLWRLYDATVYAANFFNIPLVAYSGEIDRQKQAADIMAKYLEKEGIGLTHIIGPQTPHRYHPDSKVEIDRRLDAIAAMGREAYPRKVRFVTYTLRYNRMKWVVVEGMEKHWEKASVDASLHNQGEVRVTTAGVTAMRLEFGPGGAPLEFVGKAAIAIDGQKLDAPGPASDRSWRVQLVKRAEKWALGEPEGVRKKHGLQGPIDDAFMSSFLFVMPSKTPAGEAGKRIAAEAERAVREWRRQFRGEARVKKDVDVTEADMASHHLVVWGDPATNTVLARMAAKLPVTWSGASLGVKGQAFDAATHYPALVYPNPLQPAKYVVVNSGFTYREYDYLNNARQVPKLPDWAVIDTAKPADGRYPGRVAAAGFFDEQWR
jgi:dienelactone hydrolase